MNKLRIYLFGTLQIYQAEQAISLPGSVAARSLLAYLCLHRTHPIARDVLIGIFWPKETESRARRALSQALWHIRRAIPDLITADTTNVHIPPATPLWVDVAAFKALIQPHIFEHTITNSPGMLDDLRQAIQLYRNDLLDGIHDEWIFIERESLREQYLQALELLIAAEKSLGRYTKALEYGDRLVKADPLREAAYRELMQINLALGRPEAALRYLESCQRILQTELGVDPEAETIALAKEILAQSGIDASLHLPITMDDAPPLLADGPIQLPLVGRDQERAELITCIEALFDNMGGVALVEGEAGVGKTRLLQEAVRDAEWRGAQILWGGCREIEGVEPYHALVEAIQSGLSRLRTNQLVQLLDDIWLQVLKPIIPELATYHQSQTDLAGLDPERALERLNAAFAQLFIAWGQITPIVLVIEDIHWASTDLMEILTALAAHLRDQRILILITCRSEDVRANSKRWEQIQNLDRAGLRCRLLLSSLDAKGCGELVQRALRLADPIPLFVERLYHETRGNPLFLLETLRALLDENILTQNDDGNWHTPWDATTTNYAELPTPSSIHNVIARRLENLAPQLEQILFLCAVLGEYFDFSILQAVSELDLSQLLPVLGELVRRRFLLETEEQYGFSHAQVREVIYKSMPAQKQRELHCQVGETLERQVPDQITRLAHHFYQAQIWEKNLQYSKLAGDQAVSSFANSEALEHYSRALELTPENRYADRYELLLAREKVRDLLGDRDAQVRDIETLMILADQLHSTERQAEAALRQACYAEAIGDYLSAIAAAQAAVSLAQEADSVEMEGKAFLEWGRTLWRQGVYDTARTQFEQALNLAQNPDLRWLQADVLNNLGNVCLYQGDYSQAQNYYEQTLPLHRELGNRQKEGNTLYNLGFAMHDLGNLTVASSYYQQALQIYREIGFRRGEASALNIFAVVLRDLGDYLASREYCEQAQQIFAEIGDRQSQAQALVNIGAILMDLGAYADARPYFEQGLSIQRELGDRREVGAIQVNLSSFFQATGEHQKAEQYARQALSIFQELGDRYHQGYALIYLGHALNSLGQQDAAVQAYQQSFEIRSELGETNLAMEALAGSARIALARDEIKPAQLHIDDILNYLADGTLKGCDEPVRVYLTCYQVLQASQDARAHQILTSAYDFLQTQAEKIRDEALRQSFLEQIPAHRTIRQAYLAYQEAQRGRQIEVRLPKSGAPTGRALREDEWVQVTWTLEKPEDDEISGKSNRRQHRLLRLLDEAASQGGAPTVDQLVEALDVGTRTIKRDLATLREAGHHIQTRGHRNT